VKKIFALLAICWGMLVGQAIESNTITVTVSKNLSLPPEQVTLDILVSSDATATLDDAQAFLRNAGVTGATFRAVANTAAVSSGIIIPVITPLPVLPSTLPVASVRWEFELTEPIGKLTATVAALSKVTPPGPAGKFLSATFSVTNLFASDATIADARRKALPDLIAAAQQKAKSIADAAGFSVGPVLAFRDGPGDASLIVKFALLRFSSAQ
jgi:uncharacterized protein YggE